jgi:hypothetical protein
MQHVTQHVTHAIAQRLGTSPDATFRKTLMRRLEGTILADYHKGKPPSLSLVNEI